MATRKKNLAFDPGATAPRSNDFATAVTMIKKTLAFDRGATAPRSNDFVTAIFRSQLLRPAVKTGVAHTQ